MIGAKCLPGELNLGRLFFLIGKSETFFGNWVIRFFGYYQGKFLISSLYFIEIFYRAHRKFIAVASAVTLVADLVFQRIYFNDSFFFLVVAGLVRFGKARALTE